MSAAEQGGAGVGSPGPWHLGESSIGLEVRYMRDDREFVVARLSSRKTLEVGADERADGHKLAAAPTMLAALVRLVAVDAAHETIHAPDGDDVARMVEYAAAFDEARAAIAAAQGAA